MIDTESRPVIVQGENNAVFVGSGPESLHCSSCGNILVKGYYPRQLIAISIRCQRCKVVTTSPIWDEREPLPKNLVTLGSSGNFLVTGPVDISANVTSLTCDQEINRVSPLHQGVSISGMALNLSLEQLDAFRLEIDIHTGGKFSLELEAARRARQSGNKRFTQCPLAWAVDKLSESIKNGVIQLDDGDLAALLFLQQAQHLIERWHQHPLFSSVIAKALCNEYHHSVAMLACCSYLSDVGNPIGITDTPGQNGPSPDLFVNLGPLQKISIEVKAPKELHWPATIPSLDELERKVEKLLKSAVRQLTGNSGGVVVIGANHVDASMSRRLEEAIQHLVEVRKKAPSVVAAVVGVCAWGNLDQSADGSASRISSEWRVSVALNPKFQGANPISTSGPAA